MVHSLQSANFLKVEATNSILFATAKSDKREINIQQEYEAGDQTHFQDVYGIKSFTPSLRELLLMNSIYYCQTQSQIVDIVNDQPNPTIFYKSLLELDNSNMVSMLSFDSRSMEFLLDDGFGEHFSAKYPIFFKNKVRKGASDAYYYRNAIQNAYKNNQVRAVDIILNYMIKYQNNVSCSYLLVRILPQIIEMGIEVRELCDSKIFQQEFDYDEWPGTHTNDENYIRPYNGSIYDVRHNYSTVFPEEEFAELELGGKVQSDKIYKIRYSLNLLPLVG